MTNEKMTIYQGLCELKLLDSRINDAIAKAKFTDAILETATKISGISIVDFEKNAEASLKKINALIARRDALKRSIVKSNAITQLTIAGETMSVAEAIDKKASNMIYARSLQRVIDSQYRNAAAQAEKSNSSLEAKADEYVTKLFGAKESKQGSEEITSMRDNYVKKNTVKLVDPIKSISVLEKMEETISKFISEFDSALSVSNAMTQIEFEY